MRRFHPLITGTLLLTAVGFFCRILGFFYRIFLSRTIGAEGLGLYQMIFPLHGIAFALCAGPIQTSLSRLTAASPEKGRAFLRVSLALSLSIALPLTSLIYTFADFLAARVLLAPECAPLLPALALSIPFCAIHACCCGYYYGLKKTAIPAFSQVVEQCIRIFSVLLIVHVCRTNRIPITVLLAVWGLLIGEAASAIFCLLVYGSSKPVSRRPGTDKSNPNLSRQMEPSSPSSEAAMPRINAAPLLSPLLALALPLMANRLTASAFSKASKLSLYRTSFSSPGSRGLNRSVFTEFSQAWHSPLSSFHPPSPTPSPSSCSRQSRRRRRRISRTKSNTPSPWRSDTACTWEFSASGSSPASVQHWAKPFTTTPMPDVSSRFYPGSARFSTSPPPWEVF